MHPFLSLLEGVHPCVDCSPTKYNYGLLNEFKKYILKFMIQHYLKFKATRVAVRGCPIMCSGGISRGIPYTFLVDHRERGMRKNTTKHEPGGSEQIK